ncbi:MAG: hypothetical protein SGILL_007256, partial [Bacillariaceae sp.]
MVKNLKTLDIRLQLPLSKNESDEDSDCTFALFQAFLNGHHSQLKELRLRNFFCRDMGLHIARTLLFGVVPALKVLELSNCAIGERGALALCEALRCRETDLVELDLRGNTLTDRDAEDFGWIMAKFPSEVQSLERIDFRENYVTPEW